MNLQDIKKAKKSFGNFIPDTPLQYSERLSKKYNSKIYLKREDLNSVRSYKVRGAYNMINSLSKKQKEKGVVCASAGNHAQGFAISCNELKIYGDVFMPVTTPEQKVYKTKQFGKEYITVHLIGDTFDEAFKASKKFEKQNGSIFIHPFDDQKIIEGQATIGLEIFNQIEKYPDFILCPVGGGGLISGITTVRNELKSKTKIIGIEPSGAPAMKESLKVGQNTTLEKIDIFIDGAAVKRVGENNFTICKNNNTRIETVDENSVCSTILEYLKEDGIVVEPAGALATDSLKKLHKELVGKTVVIIISGSNFDFERLPEVKERSMKYEGLKRYYIISFPQRPGALKDFLNCLGANDDIARFEYLKKSNKDKAPVLIGIESNDKTNFQKIENNISNMGFKYSDITNDELYFNLLV